MGERCRRMIRALLIALCLVCTVPAWAMQPDFAREAEALAQKETGVKWDGRPGRFGELSRWQITRAVWVQHSTESFAVAARDEPKARSVALKHLAWLRGQLLRRGIEPTAERLATCWHFGLGHARRASVWGQEVANLYEVTS